MRVGFQTTQKNIIRKITAGSEASHRLAGEDLEKDQIG